MLITSFNFMEENKTKVLAEEISSTLKVPTIGIGAGSSTDGQIMVCYDVIGAYSWTST